MTRVTDSVKKLSNTLIPLIDFVIGVKDGL